MTDAHAAATEPPGTLVDALAAAQGEFPVIDKKSTATIPGKDGKQGYSYSYADLGDVLAAVRPVLSAHGLALVQRTRTKDNGKVELLTELKHASGDELVSEVELGQSPGNPQAFGGALTYLRRYEVVTLLGIAAEQDRDAQDVEPARDAGRVPEFPAWTRSATDARLRELAAALMPVLGRDRTAGVVSTVRGTLDGVFPDGFVALAKLLGSTYAEALGELNYLEDVLAERNVHEAQAAKDAAERRQAEEAQAAAEAADPPAPDDEHGASDGPGPSDDNVADRDQVKSADHEPAEGYAPPPAEATGPPMPGSVAAPSIEGLDADAATAAYRAAGCTCQDPGAAAMFEALTTQGNTEQAAKMRPLIDENCPIAGHGIGF